MVAGKSACFGDPSLSDEYYYYNQSIGMLGFAAFTGMFPNVLSDTIVAYVKTADVARRGLLPGKFSAKVSATGIGFTLPESVSPGDVSAALYDARGKMAYSRPLVRGASATAGPLLMPIGKGQVLPGIYILKIAVRGNGLQSTEYCDKINWK
jgi:hypothetical protein